MGPPLLRRPLVKLTAYWTWDARIVGIGRTPREDDQFTVMEGLTVPTNIVLDFPASKARASMTRQNQEKFLGIPVLDMTRLQANIQLTP